MRRRAVAMLLGTMVLTTAAAPGMAFADDSKRPGGSITSPAAPVPDNGGDQGWGNCGHNSSAGNPHTGTMGSGGGNGGHHRGDACGSTPPGGGDTGGVTLT